MSDTLPLIAHTLPGKVEGVISLDPLTVQCQECGATDDPDTVGLPRTARTPEGEVLVVILSGIRFHARAWPDGRTDNPRLCRACRLSRGCRCVSCESERRSYRCARGER